MKILKIYGDNDFTALRVEEEYNTSTIFNYMISNNETSKEIVLSDGEVAYAQILGFETAEEFFEYFKSNIQDYDDSKHTNFYSS